MFVSIPIFGVVALVFGHSQILVAIGFFAILWPFSIPARAILITSKSARQFMKGTWMSLEDGFFYFHGTDGTGFKLPLEKLRKVVKRQGFYLLKLQAMSFIPIPESAIRSPEDRQKFEQVFLGV